MTQRLRDFLILFAAIALAICLGGVLRQIVGAQWELAIVVGVLFLAGAVVKARWPEHSLMRRPSWLYLGVAFALFETAAVVLSDFRILGYWSIPTAICLFLAFCVAHLMIGPLRDDAWRRSR